MVPSCQKEPWGRKFEADSRYTNFCLASDPPPPGGGGGGSGVGHTQRRPAHDPLSAGVPRDIARVFEGRGPRIAVPRCGAS